MYRTKNSNRSEVDNIINSLFGKLDYRHSLQKLSGGINSSVYKLKTSPNELYCLKLYTKPSHTDPRNRQINEANFLRLGNEVSPNHVPHLIQENCHDHWNLMSWIEGKKPSTFNQSFIDQICEFICQLNARRNSAVYNNIGNASEACLTHENFLEGISQRYNSLKRKSIMTTSEIKTTEWIKENLFPAADRIVSNFKDRKLNPHWNGNDINKYIVSPSDVGIHNMLVNKGKLIFIDFEYAGRDDFSKLAADWLLQPEMPLLNSKAGKELLENFKQMKVTMTNDWIERYNDILPMIYLKWCLIMLRGYGTGTYTDAKLHKLKNYFSKFSFLIS